MPGKLYYFQLNGRSGAIRCMLDHANFQYEDERFAFPEFGPMKEANPTQFPLGSAPIWEEDGFTMCQSSAILRALGIRLGYYSEDPMTCWQIDSILDFLEGNHMKWASPLLAILFGKEFADEDGAWHGHWD